MKGIFFSLLTGMSSAASSVSSGNRTFQNKYKLIFVVLRSVVVCSTFNRTVQSLVRHLLFRLLKL